MIKNDLLNKSMPSRKASRNNHHRHFIEKKIKREVENLFHKARSLRSADKMQEKIAHIKECLLKNLFKKAYYEV